MVFFCHFTDQPEASFFCQPLRWTLPVEGNWGKKIAEGVFFSASTQHLFSKKNPRVMDIQRKFLGFPINSQRCISSVLLGLHQESPKKSQSYENWELFRCGFDWNTSIKLEAFFIWHTAYPSGSLTAGPWKYTIPQRKDRLPTITFSGV